MTSLFAEPSGHYPGLYIGVRLYAPKQPARSQQTPCLRPKKQVTGGRSPGPMPIPLIASIPGMGAMLSAVVAAEIDGIERF
jgi:hypothetical protein